MNNKRCKRAGIVMSLIVMLTAPSSYGMDQAGNGSPLPPWVQITVTGFVFVSTLVVSCFFKNPTKASMPKLKAG